ncbi:oligosaccharide flippase family protein [Aestuariirhabdus litorea]|uniref:Flippase n=1 Tax=Aestuariirhabdus litorea TaxID=2528527 RepID=A0A3P3VQH0_9GAMM|nr:oligosaccharide flippase family protein [Aestuariirhabdus litorea]RRJ83896.1 flippase [Aestuariirhabdus litorea]RWW97119.1 flippase [Endozoicomonadaceae bacterium GTF-13]
MSLKRKLIRSFLGVGAIKLLSIPISFGTSIILARTLGPEGFGQYAFILALVPIICLTVSGGLPQLLTREVAALSRANRWSLYRGAVQSAHAWVAILSTIVLVTVWALFEFSILPTVGKWSLLGIAVLMVPLVGLASVWTGIIKGLGMPVYAEAPQQLVGPTALLFILSILAWQGLLNIRAAIWTQVVVAIFILLLSNWVYLKVKPNAVTTSKASYHLDKWCGALLPFTMIALIGALNMQVGVIALGLLSTDEQAGAMRIAERGGQIVAMSLTVVNMVIAPYIVQAHQEGEKKQLQKIARTSARGSFLLAAPIAAAFILAGGPIIRFAFGPEYTDISNWPLVIISAGQLFNVYFGSVAFLLSMCGHERETLKIQSIALILNFTLCIALAPTFGAAGAATGVTLSTIFWNIFLYIRVKRHLGIISTAF